MRSSPTLAPTSARDRSCPADLSRRSVGFVFAYEGDDPAIVVLVREFDRRAEAHRVALLLDGRIDDPNAGWKGRGIWTTVSTRTPFHMETGKGTTSKVMKFQMRPDTLAK